MIPEYVERWEKRKGEVEARFRAKHPENYLSIVQSVVDILADYDDFDNPDASNIVQIDHGDYQGTLLFVWPSLAYQPSTYWYVKVAYGSCFVCDTLQAIRDYPIDEPPGEDQVRDYMTLALHILQGIKKMDH